MKHRRTLGCCALVLLVLALPAAWIASLKGREHEFVSEDGGFVMTEGFKHPIGVIESQFERYRFLRGEPTMKLFRTTKLNGWDVFSKAIFYRYDPLTRKDPVDWFSQLKEKCRKEYLPTLPTVFENEDFRLFFYNQYNPRMVKVYGITEGRVFALTIRYDPSQSVSSGTESSPGWSYNEGHDPDPEKGTRIWLIVRREKEHLIDYWDSNFESLIARFDPAYDELF